MKHKRTTASGEILNMSDMTQGHIQNTIKYLEKQLSERPPEADGGDSDGAYWAAESENRHNEILAEGITNKIAELKSYLLPLPPID